MNTLGTAVVWGAVQVTLFSLAGVAIYAVARRRGPAAGAAAATASLAVAVAVSLLALSPWPHWLTVAPREGEPTAATPRSEDVDATGADRTTPVDSDEASAAVAKTAAPAATSDVAREAWNAFWQELRQTPASKGSAVWRWSAVVGTVVGLGVWAALMRMLLGVLAVERYRAATRAIDDPELCELAERLARRMGCRRSIALRETSALATPATVGWRRPLVVLPSSWREWTATERRVVLAHEIAHVSRGDYAAWLLAQLSLAVHFYHPLVHWLVRRLRLEQELAADAWGAEASGGREIYLMTLAQMALRQDDLAIAWAARPFLPNRGTFLRRIEMLRDPKQLIYVPSSWRRTTGVVAAVALAGLLVAGLRGPSGETQALGQSPQLRGKFSTGQSTSDLRYVPSEVVGLLSIRPAAILEQAEMKPLVDMFNQHLGLKEQLGLALEQIDEIQVAAVQFPKDGPSSSPMFPAELVVFRSRGAGDWNTLTQRMVRDGEPATFGKFKYTRGKDAGQGPAGYCSFSPDDHTLVLAAEPLLRRVMLAATKSEGGKHDWDGAWQKASAGQVTLMIDTSAFNHVVGPELAKAQSAGHAPPILGSFSPLWEQTQRWFAGFEVGNGLKLTSTFECATPEAAKRVRETTEAAMTLARNLLDHLGEQIVAAPGDAAGPMLILSDLAATLLKQAKLTAEGNVVQLQSEAQVDVADAGVGALVPAVTAARDAAKRAQAQNNLKQIALAFHNYADVYGHFPSAVVIGKDGKTPHSWRVAILPFVEGNAVYERYKFDEPWDSDNNKKLLAQMPNVYRDAGADPKSTFSSYFMLTGERTIGGSKDGAKFAEILDGTSNTILAVEAKRDIPWTKPDDIACDPGKPLPKFGGWRAGGFNAALADGSVRFISGTSDELVLRALITKDGGEPVQIP
jgi:beta-lactamase regulating signal transducer with metallopeptidase domain